MPHPELISTDSTPSAQHLPPDNASSPRIALLALSLIALAFCAWLLSLPLFPTADGPIHLLYTRVMQALLFGRDPGILPQYYTIKHILPPYSLYYYLLIGLAHFTSLVLADKLVICLYILLFLFGFRFLARSLGPAGNAVMLLTPLLLLNTPLGEGFVNFCLSTSLSFWTLGIWCRTANHPGSSHNPHKNAAQNRTRLLGFTLLCFVVMLTHPVPLLLLLGFCAVELLSRLILYTRQRPAGSSLLLAFRPLRPSIAALAVASTTLLYVKAFTVKVIDKSQILVATHTAGPKKLNAFHALTSRTHELARLNTLDAFSCVGPLGWLHRVALYALLLFALTLGFLGIRQSRRRHTWTPANTWTLLACLLAILLPLLPEDLNNSHGFADRLVLFIWLAALAGACGLEVASKTRRQSLLTTVCLFIGISSTILMLQLARQRITPAARQIAPVETATLPMRDQVFAMVKAPDYRGARNLTYDPYIWTAARLVRRARSVLYTVPWLDLTIIPVGARENMATDKITLLYLENPNLLAPHLAESPSDRQRVFAHINALLLDHGSASEITTPNPVQPSSPFPAADPYLPQHPWQCTPLTLYTYCTTNSAPLTTGP